MITLKEVKKRTELSEVQRWIPCSEKLPDTSDLGFAEVIVMIEGADAATFLTYYERESVWTDDCGNYYNVIAWMPLPAPYRENHFEI